MNKTTHEIYYPKTSWDGEKFSDLTIPKRRIIDSHVHCLFSKESLWNDNFKKTYGFRPPFNGSIDELLEVMDYCDVEKSVIFSAGAGGPIDKARKTNRRISEISKKHPQLMGFGYAPAVKDEKVKEVIKEAVLEQGLKGIGEIFPIKSAADFQYVFEAANELKIPVNIDSYSWKDEDAAWFRANLGKFPNMKLIFAHMGQNKKEIIELGKTFPNVYFDLSVEIHFYEARVYQQVKYLGADKILFATDFPATAWTMFDDILRVERMPLSDEEKERIFWGNVEKFLL